MSVDLKVDFCDYKAAEYAVKYWHYSKTMPVSKRVYFGAWENGVFVGAVIYALGATPALLTPYGLKQFQGCELVRVALKSHVTSVTKIISITLKLLKTQSPGLRLVVSFADTKEGHLGIIYQAGNWVYTGETKPVSTWQVGGRILHRRAYTGVNYGAPRLALPYGAKTIVLPPKHRYLYPLDRAMRRQIAPLAKPYPKRESMRPADGSNLETIQV